MLSGLLSHIGKHLEQTAFLDIFRLHSKIFRQPEDTACPSGVVSPPMGEQLAPEQTQDIGQQLRSAAVYGKPSLAVSPESALHGGRELHQAQQQSPLLGINPL